MSDGRFRPMASSEALSSVDAAEQYLRQGEPLLAYNAAQEGLQSLPTSLRLRQLLGLAVARSGDDERASQLLSQLVADGAVDTETLGMLARTHKNLALRASSIGARDRHLAAAFALYHQAYETAGRSGAADEAWYAGINAAAMAVLHGDLELARRIAREVRALCLGEPASQDRDDDYWRQATIGEAALILGDAPEAADRYARAASLARGRAGSLASTRRQAEMLAGWLPGECGWIANLLAVPPIVIFTGATSDAAAPPRRGLPAATEAELVVSLRRKLEGLRPTAVYGSVLNVTDLLFLEAALEVGAEIHIVLPFPADEVRHFATGLASGDWGGRFERVLAAADSVTVTSDHRARGSTAALEYSNLVLTGMACLRARVLLTDLRGFAIRCDSPPGGDGSLLTLWRSRNLHVEMIGAAVTTRDVAAAASMPGGVVPSEALPAGFSHEVRAMLFADVAGYSELSEDQTPHFVTQLLGAVADLNDRTAHRPEHVETAGDGMYMVFENVSDAGHYAVQLVELVTQADWGARGLPGGLNIRIALHCGPVYCGRNPVTGAPLYTGPHTSRTARIEPITPPGQVYASAAFAAVAAASAVEGLAMQYVGRLPLAKGYGLLGLYHVRGIGGPPGAGTAVGG